MFFKVLRKINNWFTSVRKIYKLSQLKRLFPGRFISNNNLIFGKAFSVHFDDSKSTVDIGKNVQFRDFCQVRSGLNGQLKIGERVFFNNNCTINCFNKITIGDDCQFGEGVKFYDMNHVHDKKDQLISQQGYSKGEIIVGKNCWFGTNVIVLKNVKIGDNVVIGANCLIYKDIPSDSIVKISQNLDINVKE